MSGDDGGRVVIGIPEEQAAARALVRVAADLYRQRHTTTTLVHAIGPTQPRTSTRPASAHRRRRSARLLHDAAEQLADLIGDRTPIEVATSTASPHAELVSQSQQAELVVVRRGTRSWHRRLREGSVTSVVAAQAACPVLILPAVDDPARDDGPVVVGLSDSRSSRTALTEALAEASHRSTGVVVFSDGSSFDLSWLTPHPAVVVRHAASEAAQAETILTASAAAQLIVVGRPHRAVDGPVGLDRLVRTLLHHSDCPVLVTPTRHRHGTVSAGAVTPGHCGADRVRRGKVMA